MTKERIKEFLRQNMKGDPVIWMVVFGLTVFSIFGVYSATGTLAYKYMRSTEHYLLRHMLMVAFGLGSIWVAHKIDYRYYSKISRLLLIISVPLLFITWLYGETINEASRWLTIPYINQSFQPSDLAKLALITNLASMLAKRQQFIEDLKESFLPMVLWCGLICGLIGLANYSTAVMLFLTCMLLMFIGRVPAKYLAILVLAGVISGTIALKVGQRLDTVVSRVADFVGGETPFQAEQSYIAIATGGITGKGPGNSDQKNFLPHPYSDFIYAILVEEYGLIGGGVVLALYLILLYRGMVVTARSSNAFGGLLSTGLTFAIVIQALTNMAVAVGLVPVTGQPLPLVSMGGTSLLFTGVSIGILLSVSRGEIDENLKPAKRNVIRKAKL